MQGYVLCLKMPYVALLSCLACYSVRVCPHYLRSTVPHWHFYLRIWVVILRHAEYVLTNGVHPVNVQFTRLDLRDKLLCSYTSIPIFYGLPPGLLSLRVAWAWNLSRELSVSDIHEYSYIGTLDHFSNDWIRSKWHARVVLRYFYFVLLKMSKILISQDIEPKE